MPPDGSPSDLDHNMRLEFQHDSANIFRIIGQFSNQSVGRTVEIVLDGPRGGEQDVSPHHTRHPEISSRQQPQTAESQHFNIQQATDAGRDRTSPAEPPVHDDFLAASGSAGSSVLNQEAIDEEHGPSLMLPIHPRLSRSRIAILVGGLSLIVLPGIMLGLLMKQVLMGIAISGAIATVVGTIAGFYFHMSKEC